MSGRGAHPSEDDFIDLAADLLDASDRAALLDHLRGCPACETRFVEVYRGAERIALRPVPPAGDVEPGRRLASRLRRLVLPAALAALLVAGLLLAPLVVSRRPADGLDYWMPLESEQVLARSAEASADTTHFREAVDAYAARDARRVIALLKGREMAGTYEPFNLLLASALVWEGYDDEAVDLLGRIDTLTLPEPARDRARFLLYVALRRGGRGDEARSIATELAAGSGEFAERARALLATP